MNCTECQNNIDDFISGNLDRRVASSFAMHIRECPECYNELEFNYCMQAAIIELTSDEDATSDFMAKLDNMLNMAIENYRLYLARLIRKRIFVIIGILIIAFHIGEMLPKGL